jgi:hypothetical protein
MVTPWEVTYNSFLVTPKDAIKLFLDLTSCQDPSIQLHVLSSLMFFANEGKRKFSENSQNFQNKNI